MLLADGKATTWSRKSLMRTHHVHKSVRFVILDTHNIARMRRCAKSSQKHKSATEILAKYNPNIPELEKSPEGLTGIKRRFVAFNGGIDKPQLQWL